MEFQGQVLVEGYFEVVVMVLTKNLRLKQVNVEIIITSVKAGIIKPTLFINN